MFKPDADGVGGVALGGGVGLKDGFAVAVGDGVVDGLTVAVGRIVAVGVGVFVGVGVSVAKATTDIHAGSPSISQSSAQRSTMVFGKAQSPFR
jgi:hypothetical protein